MSLEALDASAVCRILIHQVVAATHQSIVVVHLRFRVGRLLQLAAIVEYLSFASPWHGKRKQLTHWKIGCETL
jgi:hypothetical protein